MDFNSEDHFTGDPIKFNVALEGGDYLAGTSDYAQTAKKLESKFLNFNL